MITDNSGLHCMGFINVYAGGYAMQTHSVYSGELYGIIASIWQSGNGLGYLGVRWADANNDWWHKYVEADQDYRFYSIEYPSTTWATITGTVEVHDIPISGYLKLLLLCNHQTNSGGMVRFDNVRLYKLPFNTLPITSGYPF